MENDNSRELYTELFYSVAIPTSCYISYHRVGSICRDSVDMQYMMIQKAQKQ